MDNSNTAFSEWYAAAHEIKNCAALALANTELIRLSDENHNLTVYCDRIERAIRQINSLVLEMFTPGPVSGPGAPGGDAYAVLREVVNEYRAAFPGIVFETEIPATGTPQGARGMTPALGGRPADAPPRGHVAMPPPDLTKVFSNIIKNAAEAVPAAGGEISVRAYISGGGLTVRVCDNGPGLPDEIREKVMKGGYTTKPQGSGVGVAVCRDAARRYGGAFTLGGRPGGGGEAVLTLPAIEPPDLKQP